MQNSLRGLVGAALTVLLVIPTAGCGDDDDGLELFLTASPASLPADGSRSGSLLITLLTSDGRAAPLGSRVNVLCAESTQTHPPLLNGQPDPVSVQTDAQGIASVTFRCDGPSDLALTIQCIATHDGVRERVIIACNP